MNEELQKFLNELKEVTGATEKGNVVATAAAALNVSADPVNNPAAADLAAKALAANANDPLAAKEAEYDGNAVAQSFLKLARHSKGWHHLGADRVLENPRAFLRQKDVFGNYAVSDAELNAIMGGLLELGANGKAEAPTYREWLASTNKGAAAHAGLQNAFGRGSNVSKALDTSSGSALVRTDLEPVIWEATLREFPMLGIIPRVPANGLVHTYDQRTGYGTASFVADMGDFSSAFANSTFVRSANSNIATLIAPRAISLKLQYATRQSGMSFDLAGDDNLEVMGAIWAIGKLNQSTILQGNQSTAAKTKDDEEGAYNANGFDGFRAILKGASTSLTKAAGDSFVTSINRGVGQIANAGGSVRNLMVAMSYGAQLQVNNELQNLLRIMSDDNKGAIPSNFSSNGLVTIGGWPSRIQPVPAGAQTEGTGYYTITSTVYEDMTIIDPTGCAMAYLGSPTPTVLELPVGYNNFLSNVFIPFQMNGLVVHIPNFHRKVRVAYSAL